MTDEARRAVRRVLKLVDGYLSKQQQDTLFAYKGGLMTCGELRQNLQAAEKLVQRRAK